MVLAVSPLSKVAPAATPGLAIGSGVTPAVSAVTVTWDGVPVGSASSPATAFLLAPGGSSQVVFAFQQANTSDPASNATLALRYLDDTLSTESIPTSGPPTSASADLTWTFGSLAYLTQGVYELVAELLDPAGNVLFRQVFYVDVEAPYVIGSAIALFAVVLAGAEAYWIAVLLRAPAARRRRYRTR